MSRVLLMVPHEDDELLVGGPMLVNLCRNGYEVFVYIATNGDYYPFESAARARESLKALKLMGVERSNVFFGGYGDAWQGTGIYDSGYLEEKISAAGYRETHGPAEGIDEWRYIRTNEHAPYTKGAYLEDIFELIDRLRPDVLISTGFDDHPDHRALCLLVFEALALLYAKDPSYSPAFLEKTAYEGNLFGKNDFFRFPHRPSAPPLNNNETAYNDWERRICYRVPKDCNSFFLATNLIFRVLRCYRTQRIWQMADRVINSDTVYWQRNPTNKVLGAEITSSSGEVRWLNDNKLFEPVSTDEMSCDFAQLCFRPEPADSEKTVRVKLKEPSALRLLLLYFNTPGGISTDVRLILHFEDGSEQTVQRTYESEKDFSVLKMELDGRTCREFSLSFENAQGSLGLGEIEGLEKEPEPPFEEFRIEPQKIERSLFLTGVLQFEWLLFATIRRISRRIKTPYDRKKERFDQTRSDALPFGDNGKA